MQSGSLEPPELCDQRHLLDLPLLSKSTDRISGTSSYYQNVSEVSQNACFYLSLSQLGLIL